MEESTKQPINIKKLTIVIKPTLSCNQSCSYCSPGCGTVEEDKRFMSEELFRHFIESLRDYCKNKKIDLLTFIWHGGEPTLMPISFYKRARDLQKSILEGSGIAVFNTIQTNLTNNVDKINEVASVMGISTIGTSYDPDGLRALRSAENPSHPKDTADRDDFRKRWLINFMSLRKKYSIGAIYVINTKTPGRERQILSHFTNLGVASLKLNWMYRSLINSYADDYILSPEEWGESILQFSNINYRFPLHISEFSEFRTGRFSCSFCGSKWCSGSFMGVSPEGGIFNCGRMIECGIPYGDIKEKSITVILEESGLRKSMSERDDVLQNSECSGCNFWKWCHGGCACDSYLANNTILKKTNMCEGYKKMFGGILNAVQCA